VTFSKLTRKHEDLRLAPLPTTHQPHLYETLTKSIMLVREATKCPGVFEIISSNYDWI